MALIENMATVNGKQVHYWEDGNNVEQTILLLHGGFGNAQLNWQEAIPHLADEYHVIAPDLPGYGQSESIRITVQNLVDWTRYFIDHLQLEQVVIVGHSFGGLITRIFASQNPKYTPAIVLVNGGVIPAVPLPAKVIAYTPVIGSLVYNQIAKSTTKNSSLESTLKTEEAVTAEFREAVQAEARALGKLMRALSISPVPSERVPPLPVLLLWGEEDSVTPRVVGEYIQRNLKGSKLSLIADVGHMPQVEVPDVFAWQVKQFLKDLNRPRRQGISKLG